MRDPGTLYLAAAILCLGAVALDNQLSWFASDGMPYVNSPIDLGGNTTSLAILSMGAFSLGGFAYSSAWGRDESSSPKLGKAGDIISGFGAALFTVGMYLAGHPMIATFGLLIVVGKLGSAVAVSSSRRQGIRERGPASDFKDLTVLGRFAMLAVVMTGLFEALASLHAGAALVLLATAIACLFWLTADGKMLTRSSRIKRLLYPRFTL